jgi:putative phosphoribosyl transferase
MKSDEIVIPIGKSTFLQGELSIPTAAKSLVIFSHGSGSSRYSSRNRHVARMLNKESIATLLIDLLTETENAIYETRFDIDLLTERLVTITSRVRNFSELRNCSIGYFGASTGAASALQAAARLGDTIHAVVSRGGRPDLAKNLIHVKAPTLLIVGSLDTEVIRLNQQAYTLLGSEKKMEIIEGASHLFEEPNKLDEVTLMATEWFRKYLLNINTRLHAIQ